ncbi:methyltryptophan oxidase [Salinicoccus sediminis]|uniref:Methyltryptophan oxidase n=1 Tax=Salinicoccus sediminis TaxID=1432562 RepID=A0A0M2SLC5_9STAP|nr:N-methyl-L-tryptophan oxidase [Salinicoccus sediminis]KKK35038.1 methyltryptophan oxidase [Salinicoccus sediminis]
MNNHYDVIVVGAGAMGMAAGYYLSQKGIGTLMIDAFDPPHENGSHSGDTRIIRHACGEGPEYAPLGLRSQELWDELQGKTSESLFRKTGVLTFGKKGSEFVEQAVTSGRRYDMNIEALSADEIMGRWPGITLPEDNIGCYEPDAGVLFAGNCIRAFRRLALENGAELMTDSPVTSIDVETDSVRISTRDGVFTADKLIITAGAWNKKILSYLDLEIAIQPSRRVIGWFDSEDRLYAADKFPGFICDMPGGTFYGFPSIEGTGVKVGCFDNGVDGAPEYMNREFGAYGEDEADLRYFLGEYMPQANGKLNVGKTCMFTNTPDEDFVIDLHPEYDHIAIAAGFSGHGYKFSSVVGEILSALVTKGGTSRDISSFSAGRQALYPDKSGI